MITTTEIAPSPALAPFIRCYCYHEMDTKGLDVVKPWHASNEMWMDFYFKDKPLHLNNPNTGQFINGGYGHVVGFATEYNGEITFNGCYSVFSIIFKATGFNKIFRIPTSEITNLAHYSSDIFDRRYKILFDQLSEANGLIEMTFLANRYFLYHLNKQKSVDYKDVITPISNLITKKAGLVSIDKLAYDANMSIRSFERHFIEHVGMSPKLFSCITRFNHAFDLKLRNPDKDWTAIAHESGYFDQMHLIKDFKRFTGNTPSSFLKQTPLREETFNSRVER